MKDNRYPIGDFVYIGEFSKNKDNWIAEIERLPKDLEEIVKTLSDEQLETSYRDGAWTVRQIVHHIADSHMNSYIRFRWAVTENQPTIKAYDENDWAKLPDAKNAAIELSLDLIKALHARWVWFLRELTLNDYKNSFVHPESCDVIGLEQTLAYYAWHGKHHLAHIKIVKEV